MVSNKNHLINEKSPYLLQHAHNPVNWFPWGEEAFDEAKRENKPVFLSIGYSTCHWCHVMAEESFEDKKVADLLNKHYISIKVDREERPDIDQVYMKVCQMMTGQGGWPLTIIMTPKKVPFYAGTFFPKYSMHGLPGIMEMLEQLQERYHQDKEQIAEVTKNVEEALAETAQKKSEQRINTDVLQITYQQLSKSFDAEFGGFSSAPKFPQPQNIHFLFDYFEYYGEDNALAMAEKTLQQMAKGGIYDHIGYGFARYSTDRGWLVPHFEKMLYDNALLLGVFVRAYALTEEVFYKEISEDIIYFISREMKSAEGAFYSAIDADSDGIEGKYYVWSYETLMEVLGEETGEAFAELYGMTPTGNFEGKNIPNLIHHSNMPPSVKQWKDARQKLLKAREQRIYPHVDDKVLTSWNTMMIQALAYAGNVLNNQNYIETAEKSMHFIESHLFNDKRLMARYRDGETKFKGYLDDYAYLIWSYITLYEATMNLIYLKKAKEQCAEMIILFWDVDHGGFFLTSSDSEQLISRDKEVFDGALPSGNGIAAMVLMKLSGLTGEYSFQEKAEEMYYSFYEDISGYPAAAAFFVKNLFLTDFPRKEVVVIGNENDTTRQMVLNEIRSGNFPNVSLLVAEDPSDFTGIASFASDYKKVEGKTTIYVCESFSCHKPTTQLHVALQYIRT